MRGRLRCLAAGLLAVLAWPAPAPAAVELGADGRLTLSGDFRLRLEADWDSRRPDGSPRDDRTRARVRARLGLGWKISERLSFTFRLRSGSDASQQSPHITVVEFDGNDTGDAHFNPDRWALRYDDDHRWAWAGRNSWPFWKQNDLMWDDDVTVAGVAGGWRAAAGENGKIALALAWLTPPVGMQQFTGTLGGGQLVYTRERPAADEPAGRLTLAAGLYAIDADPGDPDARLLRNGNGLRDYSILAVSGQLRRQAGGRPLVAGLDWLHNSETYGPGDPYGFANRDETDGFVASLAWGSTADRGDWLVGYWYAEIGALAVHASYAGDDWMRWGSGGQADASDYRGHELRVAWGLGPTGNLVARLFLIESLTSPQDGNRFRLDYNLRF